MIQIHTFIYNKNLIHIWLIITDILNSYENSNINEFDNYLMIYKNRKNYFSQWLCQWAHVFGYNKISFKIDDW